ncbi:uncharacterized protein G2W53_044914 [Senna tora]|uniref:Uncharacterized protein n=1 Tax=Senna tora TaxID=362788 RepID=A0A834SD14_9FABA|nr:uncharacterized protein G2W53_044914 [Senna tora]
MTWHTSYAITSSIRALDPLGFPLQRKRIRLTHLGDKTFELVLLGFF